jgi:hypothetical protein
MGQTESKKNDTFPKANLSAKMEVKLSEIFIFKTNGSRYSKESLMALDINMELTERLSEYLGLTYLESNEVEGNLCYAQNKNIRSGYRMVFSKPDILNYLDRQLKPGTYYIETDTVVFPRTMDFGNID